MSTRETVTQLLLAWSDGDAAALDRLTKLDPLLKEDSSTPNLTFVENAVRRSS
jgi:hypothetical protein